MPTGSITYLSDLYEVMRGVQQGSILEPLLFDVYLNSSSANVNASTVLYADDSTAVCVGHGDNDLKSTLLSTIGQLQEWYKK